MIKKTIYTLLVTILLALLATPTLYAQENRGRSIDRERLRAVMDPNGDPEAFRREVSAYLSEMQEVSRMYQELYLSLHLKERVELDPLALIAEAQRRLPEMTAEELVVMRTAYARNPIWRDVPQMLDSFIKPQLRQQIQANLAANGGAVKGLLAIPNDCGPARSANITVTDISIARGVEIAVNSIMEGFPTDWTSILARIAPIAANAAASVAVLTLETLYGIKGDCDADDFERDTRAFFSRTNEKLDANVSTLATAQNLSNLATHVTNNLDAKVSSRVSQDVFGPFSTFVTGRLDDTIISRASQTSLDGLNTFVTVTVKSDLDELKARGKSTEAAVDTIDRKLTERLDVKVSSRATQSSVNTLQGTANTINTKADTTLIKLDQTLVRLDELEALIRGFQADNIRMQIEMNFLHGPRYNIAQFQDPSKLALVKTIVEDTIAKGKAAGVPQAVIDQANNEMTAAAAYLKGNGFKDTYAHYRMAYLLIATNPIMREP